MIRLPKKYKLPSLMVRVSALAKLLSSTEYVVLKMCEENGVPVVRAGLKKIKMVSTKKFLEIFDNEED